MAAIPTTRRTTNGRRGSAPAPPEVPGRVGPARIRHPLRVAVGAVVVVLCALVGALVFQGVDQRRPMLVLVRTVQPGQTITADDLGQANVSASGISTMTPSQRAQVIGRVASGRLPAGSAVAAGELNAPSRLSPDVVELPMTLKAGSFPPALAVGDSVLVVPTPGTAAAVSGSTPETGPVPGQVTDVVAQNSVGGSAATVTVTVPKATLSALAAASAAGQVVLATEGAP